MIYVFLANGFEEAEAIVPIDYMRRAGIEVTTVGVGTSMPRSSHGITVMADISEDMFFPGDDVEAVFFPGGGLGVENLSKSETVRRAARLGFGKRRTLKRKESDMFPGLYRCPWRKLQRC